MTALRDNSDRRQGEFAETLQEFSWPVRTRAGAWLAKPDSFKRGQREDADWEPVHRAPLAAIGCRAWFPLSTPSLAVAGAASRHAGPSGRLGTTPAINGAPERCVDRAPAGIYHGTIGGDANGCPSCKADQLIATLLSGVFARKRTLP